MKPHGFLRAAFFVLPAPISHFTFHTSHFKNSVGVMP